MKQKPGKSELFKSPNVVPVHHKGKLVGYGERIPCNPDGTVMNREQVIKAIEAEDNSIFDDSPLMPALEEYVTVRVPVDKSIDDDENALFDSCFPFFF